MDRLKKVYINFIEKENKNIWELFLFFPLYILSLLYAAAVALRNFLFDHNFLTRHSIGKKVISVGNISWGGSGKTSLVTYLHTFLKSSFKVASITKGYAKDEFLLLQEKVGDVFDAKDRVALLKMKSSDFDVFILDDGFQYRKLSRNLDIVVMGTKEFREKAFLLPAYILREPLKSLRRAQIVILNYSSKIKNIASIREKIKAVNPRIKIYLADYQFKGFLGLDRKPRDFNYFKDKKLAVLTAIGYPEGFVDNILSLKLQLQEKIIYPDHHRFTFEEISDIENKLQIRGIKDVVITYKDFYHLDLRKSCLNYFILDVELKIKDQDKFLEDVKKAIA